MAATSRIRFDEDEIKLLEWMLLRRRHRLIDLGIARYGRSSFTVRCAFLRGDVGVRCAAWSNVVVASSSFLTEGWYTRGDLMRLVTVAPKSEIEAFASNPRLGDRTLEHLIKREGVFEELSPDKYICALTALSENPRLGARYDESRLMDGWAEFMHGLGAEAAWGLTKSLPADQGWAAVLVKLLTNCPQPGLLKDVDDVIVRWRIDAPAKDGAIKVWRDNSFYLRSRIADLKKADQALLLSDDLALRLSFYRRFTPWEFRDWPKFLERDGRDFAEAALENEHLWHDKNERQRLKSLCWGTPDASSDMILPSRHKIMERRMRALHPQWFHSEDDEFSNQEDAILRRLEKRVDELTRRIKDVPAPQRFKPMTAGALKIPKTRYIPSWLWFVAGAAVVLILRSLG